GFMEKLAESTGHRRAQRAPRVPIDVNYWLSVSQVIFESVAERMVKTKREDYWFRYAYAIPATYAWALGRVIPRSQVLMEKRKLVVRDPRTLTPVIELSNPHRVKTAWVNPDYRLTVDDVDGLLRSLAGALSAYVITHLQNLTLYGGPRHLLTDFKELAEDLFKHAPLPSAEVAEWISRVLETYGYPGVALYRVDHAEGLPSELWYGPGLVSAETVEDGVEVKVEVSGARHLRVAVTNPFSFHADVHVAEVSGNTAKVVVEVHGPFIYEVPSAELVEKLLFGWREIAVRAIESKLMQMQRRGVRGEAAESLTFWRALLRSGEWVHAGCTRQPYVEVDAGDSALFTVSMVLRDVYAERGSFVEGLPLGERSVPITVALAHAVPGATVTVDEIVVRDPETGEPQAVIPLLAPYRLYVHPSHATTELSAEEKAREIVQRLLRAVYTVLVELHRLRPRAVRSLVSFEELEQFNLGYDEEVAQDVRRALAEVAETICTSPDAELCRIEPPYLRYLEAPEGYSEFTAEIGRQRAKVRIRSGELLLAVDAPFRYRLRVVGGRISPGWSQQYSDAGVAAHPLLLSFGLTKYSGRPWMRVPEPDVVRGLVHGWRETVLSAIERRLEQVNQEASEASAKEAELLEFWRNTILLGE
ncbi:MAG: hypothetical protein QXQ91_01190, partial [Nanopusillaceae archaeon]